MIIYYLNIFLYEFDIWEVVFINAVCLRVNVHSCNDFIRYPTLYNIQNIDQWIFFKIPDNLQECLELTGDSTQQIFLATCVTCQDIFTETLKNNNTVEL